MLLLRTRTSTSSSLTAARVVTLARVDLGPVSFAWQARVVPPPFCGARP
jgi:hypothetical protein